MAPEQACGKPVDERVDVGAFGCILYEMLSARKTFDGESLSEIVASVLKSEPDWAALPRGTPPQILRLLRRCLAKDPAARFHDIADARLELTAEETSEAVSPRARGRSWIWAAALGSAVLAFAAGAWWGGSRTTSDLGFTAERLTEALRIAPQVADA